MRGRTRTVLIAAILVFLSVSLLGCDLFTGPEIRIELAAIDTSEVAPTVPSAVAQGRSFVVEIPVLLNCNELGPVEVEEYPAGVVLKPQIRMEVDPNVLCPGAIRFGTHLVELSWEEPHDFEVMIYAVDVWAGRPLLLRYPVEVRPQHHARLR